MRTREGLHELLQLVLLLMMMMAKAAAAATLLLMLAEQLQSTAMKWLPMLWVHLQQRLMIEGRMEQEK